jgi:SAM-dependent methyltransferase
VSFAVAGDAYDALVGRWSRLLAPDFAEFTGIADLPEVASVARAGSAPALDVGCGPGALTAVLAARLGPEAVVAVDPSPPFVAACRARVPGAEVREGSAERLPFADRSFGAALAQLVISFVPDASAAVAEMRRVVRPGGVVAACTWAWDGFDLARVFWDAALRVDPAAPDDAGLPFRREGELEALFRAAGLRDVEAAGLPVQVT